MSSTTPADAAEKQHNDIPSAASLVADSQHNKTDFSAKEDLESGDIAKELAGSSHDDIAKPPAESEEPLIKGKQMVGVMVALALSMFLAALDNTIVATMLPKIAQRFNALASASWIVSSYIIASTALQPIYGKLCNIYGHQRVLLLSHAFFLIGSVICGASKSANMLIAGRAIAGVGGSGLMSICFVVIGDIVPTAQSPMYISVFGLVWAIASVAGPLLGGVFADRTGFEWGFYINPCVQAVVIVLIVLFMRLPRPEGSAIQKLQRVDFIGVVAIVAGIVLLQLGLTWGGREYKWSSAAVVSTLVLGILVLVGFAFIEWKIPAEPLMPLHLFRRRNASLMFIAQVTFGMLFFLPIFYFPIYLSVVKNATAISSGLHLVSCMLAISLFSIMSGVLITKTGKYLWFIWIGTAFTIAGLGLFVLLGPNPPSSKLIGIPILFGAGIGLAMQPMISCAQNAVDPEDVATTTTLFMTIRMLGSAIGLAIAQSIFQNQITPKLAALSVKYPDAKRIIFGVIDNQSVIWMPGVPTAIRDEIISAYVKSMHTVYLAFLAFGGLTLIVSLFAKNIPLRKTLGAVRAE